jgi:hypothetical protein
MYLLKLGGRRQDLRNDALPSGAQQMSEVPQI